MGKGAGGPNLPGSLLLGTWTSGGKHPGLTPAPKYLWPSSEAGIRRTNSFDEGQELSGFAALGQGCGVELTPVPAPGADSFYLGSHVCLAYFLRRRLCTLCAGNLGLRSPHAVNICYFCPEELSTFSFRKWGGCCGAGADPLALNFQLPPVGGRRCARAVIPLA